ncbi:hypothetical protein L7F22_054752 [Adiantum nelumboides]|nr:hypothetical protein [Adiantum nelumboides]MCO5600637.1 hypothetical protein [Adiantum nelumboides]
MVKGRASSTSSERPRPCPPLASLSLASAHLKPSIIPSPLFSLLKRPPLSHTEKRSMKTPRPSPPSPSIFYDLDTHNPEEELCTDASAAAASTAASSWRTSSNAMDIPAPAVDGADDDDDDDDDDNGDDDYDDDEDDTPESGTQAFICGRQRLQLHCLQVSGKVTIPDKWGCEQQLQEWVSYGIVEDALRPAGLMSARTALVSECQHRGGKPVRAPPAMSADVEVS